MHPRFDSRIYFKQCVTLANAFGSVILIVADGKGDETIKDVRIVDLGKNIGGRVQRIFAGWWRAYAKIRKLKATSVHFHDPELLPLGVMLRVLGLNIIYDVHEDLPRQILSKPYLSSIVRRPLAYIIEAIEWMASRLLSANVVATPFIANRFQTSKTIVVHNYPILSEFQEADVVPYSDRAADFAYVGGLVYERGAREMVDAIGKMKMTKSTLRIAGDFQDKKLRNELVKNKNWARVDYVGWLNREGISNLLREVRAGLVVLHPTKSYVESYPIKLFEYMAAGLPVIASDFPLWRSIIDDAKCGILVDPLNVDEIAGAMNWVLDNPLKAEEMGRNGRQFVEEKYNWHSEGKKLVSLYRNLGNN